ncbi:hypothetical protein, partial [Enterococcus aquimarinus]|uniref:hypothetical protein n=1 Tax=Enterococcus aquimarinus TaxID=328396 RepID=UPI001B80AF37
MLSILILIREKTIEQATPYILVLTAIVTMILLLPSKVKVPILFFGLLFIIFFVACLLIYYITPIVKLSETN